ncbi:hypothetical protein ASPFODRAFT_48722 [Aspergillus luchuensis CBS 106.47]|uniref:Uncharacterized protein n=1 Tax=Aspergillus luchuensis (strain CBS 106.47) TaxID=1137211 RepID=A0A1M3TD13_ASPLC|nr:hypothetical protein ASPFODRAFT_48722 [Aspergillus luchuensis CBS 106.47]
MVLVPDSSSGSVGCFVFIQSSRDTVDGRKLLIFRPLPLGFMLVVVLMSGNY